MLLCCHADLRGAEAAFVVFVFLFFCNSQAEIIKLSDVCDSPHTTWRIDKETPYRQNTGLWLRHRGGTPDCGLNIPPMGPIRSTHEAF
jgi:hypothetical protein